MTLGRDTDIGVTVKRKFVLTTKILECNGGYSANDVVSESQTNTEGTDWDFDFGGVGYITSCVVHHITTGMVARYAIYLYSKPPTCELDDNAANTGPVAADVPYFLGVIMVQALADYGTGPSHAMATPSTMGNLPILFATPKVYAVVVTLDAEDPGDSTLLSITLGADLED